MNLRQLVNKLTQEGHKVTFRERTDRGIVITSVDGKRFKGKAGNVYVREYTGEKLSRRRAEQLSRLKVVKHRRVEPLTAEMKKELQKAQRLFREHNVGSHKEDKRKATIKTAQVRASIQKVGYKETLASLKRAQKYAKNEVFIESIEAVKLRLQADIEKEEVYQAIAPIEDIIEEMDYIIDNNLAISQDLFSQFLQKIYDWENNTLESEELFNEWRKVYKG